MNVLGEPKPVLGCSCINCGVVIDLARCVDGDYAPEPGDITVCIYCGHVMAFCDSAHLRDLTSDEVIMVAGDPRLQALQRARSAAKEESIIK